MTEQYFISSPVHSMQGDIVVPGDKSISHRAIMLGAIAEGITTVDGFLDGEDCLATLRSFESMGVCVEKSADSRLMIHGVGKYGLKKPAAAINCGNSGTSMRLLAGILAAQPFDSELTGDNSLLNRPMARISLPLMEMGADVLTHDGCPPISIRGGRALQGITYTMTLASAQVKSCLLLAGMYAEGDTRLMESSPTRDHTERMLTQFSYPIQYTDGMMVINAASQCIGTTIVVPGDISSAAFFIVAATLIPGSTLCIRNVGVNQTRTGILHILKRMGANITLSNRRFYGEEPVADLLIRHAPLHGIEIPVSIVPAAIDEFPALFIAAACASGQTILHGAQELRHKESDRIRVMADGLNQLGIEAKPLRDGLFIRGGTLSGGVVDSQHDHRVAMAFAIAGAVATGPIKIMHASQVVTSFPTFVALANQVNLSIKAMNDE
ncbi:MAG TPA: 3-phosphoshikimate 1-carboxyvinyltransferase [Legionella sp.]|nr:3-phosphoshikimate 1-carboxyvinyltransferase [Legionella sp.]